MYLSLVFLVVIYVAGIYLVARWVGHTTGHAAGESRLSHLSLMARMFPDCQQRIQVGADKYTGDVLLCSETHCAIRETTRTVVVPRSAIGVIESGCFLTDDQPKP